MRALPLALLSLSLFGCPSCSTKKPPPPPPPPERCEVDLAELGLFSAVGSGTVAREIETEADLIGGPTAEGSTGDFLIANDKVRFVIQKPGRVISAVPYGGIVLDADRVRTGGIAAGRDHFGRMGFLHSFGRTVNVSRVEVLRDGSGGGYSVIAATGTDALLDYINVQSVLEEMIAPGVKLVVNPDDPLPLQITTYYVLSPGESRLRMLTAVCNLGNTAVVTAVGDLIDSGGAVDFFNPAGCANGIGARGCSIDPSPWFGYQARSGEVAYGVRTYRLDSPAIAEPSNALLTVSGVVGTLTGGQNAQGVLSWVDPQAGQRPGTFGVTGGGQNFFLRDLFVGRDLGEISSTLATLDGTGPVRLVVTAVEPDGATPAPGARISVVSVANQRQQTLLVADPEGKARVDLQTGSYRLQIWRQGHALPTPVDVAIPSTGTTDVKLTLGATRKLTVEVQELQRGPSPAKVTVLCPGGLCALQSTDLTPFIGVEVLPSRVAAIDFVPPQGRLELQVPPGTYEVVVTRGPEYSTWPQTWPAQGQPVDLNAADQLLQATLVRVVDTTGWMSADLHVHSEPSPDSAVSNTRRVLNFAAEGVDVLCSTDHDVVTDYAPTIIALGATHHLASMIGDEVTSFDYGHFNAFPLTRKPTLRGGPFDWAGGDGPNLRLPQLFAGLHAEGPNTVVQLNHGRGSGGAITQLQVDTATGKSRADPATFRMAPADDATADDTRLFSNDFDAMEVQNGLTHSRALMNDWMTFLSRGALKAATAVSDTHGLLDVTGGYSRTFVQVGSDATETFDPSAFAVALKARRAIGTNGPFLQLTAQRLDGPGGAPVGMVAGVGQTLSVPAGATLRLTLDAQAPDWMTFDVLEIHSHATGREAAAGQENSTWPAARILQTRTLNAAALPRVPVTSDGATLYQRIHVKETFEVTAAADTWFVAMLRSTSATATLFPLAYDGSTCSGGNCQARTARPEAFTNAILIDADGSGAYDEFPLKLTGGLRLPPRPAPAAERRVPTLEELERALREWLADH